MKLRTLFIPAISVLAMNALGPIVKAQNCPAPEYQKLVAELRQVKADVLQLLLDSQTDKVKALQGELGQIQQQQLKLQQAEQIRRQQLVSIEEQLADPELEKDARPQVESVREQLIGNDAESLRSELSAAQERETDLMRRLRIEFQRLQMMNRKFEESGRMSLH